MIILSGNIIFDGTAILLLHRKDHDHFETPGGKIERHEYAGNTPTVQELAAAARRELLEELGENITISSMQYFQKVQFTIPDGREAIAHKFLVRISGTPNINEPALFDELRWFPIEELPANLSPDLQLLRPSLHSLR